MAVWRKRLRRKLVGFKWPPRGGVNTHLLKFQVAATGRSGSKALLKVTFQWADRTAGTRGWDRLFQPAAPWRRWADEVDFDFLIGRTFAVLRVRSWLNRYNGPTRKWAGRTVGTSLWGFQRAAPKMCGFRVTILSSNTLLNFNGPQIAVVDKHITQWWECFKRPPWAGSEIFGHGSASIFQSAAHVGGLKWRSG